MSSGLVLEVRQGFIPDELEKDVIDRCIEMVLAGLSEPQTVDCGEDIRITFCPFNSPTVGSYKESTFLWIFGGQIIGDGGAMDLLFTVTKGNPPTLMAPGEIESILGGLLGPPSCGED